jgi:hypothetical protein
MKRCYPLTLSCPDVEKVNEKLHRQTKSLKDLYTLFFGLTIDLNQSCHQTIREKAFVLLCADNEMRTTYRDAGIDNDYRALLIILLIAGRPNTLDYMKTLSTNPGGTHGLTPKEVFNQNLRVDNGQPAMKPTGKPRQIALFGRGVRSAPPLESPRRVLES